MSGRVAVLGANGFAGRAIAIRLQADGWRVRAVTRTASRLPGSESEFLCDARHPADLARAIGDCDAVVNAVSGGAGTDVPIARVLRDALRGGRIGHAIQISSLSVYGAPSSTVDEASEPMPAPGHGYAVAKLRAERVLIECAGAITILRPGCLYGIGGRQWVELPARLLQAGRLGLLGRSGEGNCHLLHVQDLAEAAAQAARLSGGAGRVNLLSPERLTWNEYFVRLAGLLGLPKLQPVSRAEILGEAWCAAPILHAARRIAGAQTHALTPSMLRLFALRTDIRSNRLPLVPAGSFTPLKDGLAEAVRQFLQLQPPAPIRAIRRPVTA